MQRREGRSSEHDRAYGLDAEAIRHSITEFLGLAAARIEALRRVGYDFGMLERLSVFYNR